MWVKITIISELGNFNGESIEVTPEQCSEIEKLSMNFYDTGFEMRTDDGGFVIIPPDVIKKSIMKINKNE